MKVITVLSLLLVLSPNLAAQTRAARRIAPAKQTVVAAPAAPSLPIRRIILYSNGVAFFERRGAVQGNAEVTLPFKQSQVDDVLKSMIVLDLGRGRIGAVSYNTSAPPSARLNEIPFSIDAGTNRAENETLGGLQAVLEQLQGARVIVTTATRSATGAILTVEERKSQVDANKPPALTHTLVIASEGGEIVSFDLAEVRSIKLLDEGARHDINEFATISASARRQDAKTIVVTSDGEGQRDLSVSYTVAAPIWKTSYRVVLDQSGQPFFQGWAIVDNVSEEDWSGIELSLVSGTPVSFIQPLQQPLYRHRPVMPIPEDLQLEPQVYEPESRVGTGYGIAGGVGSGNGTGVGPGTGYNMGGGRPAPPAAPPPGPTTTLSDAITSEESGVQTAASGNEVGDLFEYRVDRPVTVRRDRSALIPILQTRMEGERISIYNEAARADRPMSGLRLKNTSPLTLEGGPLTVIDGNAYAGEALIERLKPGENRFISFALDLATLVTARTKIDRERTFLIRTLNGVFQAHYYQTNSKTYVITNQTDRPRTVFVEHPVQESWKLTDETAKPFETTASFYRFRVEVGPRQIVELPVTERRALMENYALSNLTPRDLEVFVSRNYVDASTRAALQQIIDIKSKIAAVDARLQALDAEAAEISQDQARLRENITALRETGEARQLIARYVAKAGEQETRIEQIASERKAAAAERVRLQSDLDAAIRALDVNRKM